MRSWILVGVALMAVTATLAGCDVNNGSETKLEQ
ncbi:MAG: hypothetical protein K0Q73_9020, partial [Paenibacillus sp.]|nr:hypothetical protein [Paenibacillus sp.]